MRVGFQWDDADVVGTDTSPVPAWGPSPLPTPVMNYSGLGGFSLFLSFFFSFSMYSCQHAVGSSLINPRQAVLFVSSANHSVRGDRELLLWVGDGGMGVPHCTLRLAH